MLYSGFIALPRSVIWSAYFNDRSDNADVIRLPMEIFRHSNGKFAGTEYSVLAGIFPEPIEISIDNDVGLDFANDCALILKNLTIPIVDHLCRATELYCNDFLYFVGKPLLQFSNKRSVLESVCPTTLIIPEDNPSREPLVHMELNYNLVESELGMEWVVRDSGALYVGPWVGYDPYEEFKEQHPWNYAWQTVESV